MAVDKNLFLYDLAVVAIMKNEAPYAKEWLDYHLLAEMPKILPLDYPVVDDIRRACTILIPQIQNAFRVYDPNAWKEFVNLQYALNVLKTFDEYSHD
ncbi:MAG: hypothetical protein J5809_05170 [Selenomonadaceae bacterium]|nr:hypothetical protein [Selenomonadaceae bacterium]